MEPIRPLRQEPVRSRPEYKLLPKITEETKARSLQSVPFFSLVFVTLTLIPGMAHVLEMPSKMQLSAADYLTVQQIYQGWSAMGIFVIGSLLLVAGWAYLVQDSAKNTFKWVTSSFVALVLAQVVYWTFTFPANRVTESWTTLPENWSALRNQWEYSHLAGATLTAVALLCLFAALIAPARTSTVSVPLR